MLRTRLVTITTFVTGLALASTAFGDNLKTGNYDRAGNRSMRNAQRTATAHGL
jgi:hypothetical protein